MTQKFLDLEVQVDSKDDLKIINETLTRIGIPSSVKKGLPRKLFQSCHLLEVDGKCYIVHFKELYAYTGREATLTNNDYARRNSIAFLLETWGLLKVKNPEKFKNHTVPMNNIFVISFNDKRNWELKQKYFGGR